MARSDRLILRGVQGRVRHNHNFVQSTKTSAVIITQCGFALPVECSARQVDHFWGTQQMS